VHGKFFIGQLGAKTRPYALAGLAWHRLSVTTSDEPRTGGVESLGNDDEDVSGELGLDLAAGAVVRVQETVDIGGEARLRRLMDQTVIASDQLALVGTIAYKM
jgi:opacity protein-like surface antigen